MLSKVPHEIVASILAATTAFVGGNALHLPPWAIFIAWAGTYLAGGPHLAVMKRLWAAMPVGSAAWCSSISRAARSNELRIAARSTTFAASSVTACGSSSARSVRRCSVPTIWLCAASAIPSDADAWNAPDAK